MGPKVEMAMNPWEAHALNYQFPDDHLSAVDVKQTTAPSKSRWRAMEDPVFYPGLYSASGYDLIAILLRLMARPNPQLQLGAVDCSVALLLCDLEKPNEPIVYTTDAFCDLSGYSKSEVLGRNCRFLQSNPTDSGVERDSNPVAPKPSSDSPSKRMRQAIDSKQEIQTTITNYRKNGESFKNCVSIIPLTLDDSGHQYAVGFCVEVA
ncbi:hypothetical protein E4U11_000468 [Claviceps purpurea]|nr:hypothetical protein E4U11_000468 [Claviceps purpurea]